MARICRLFGITRQAYYQQTWSNIDRKTEQEIVLQLVQAIRGRHPRIGVRKIYHMLETDLIEHQIKMGRDAMFNLLAANQLLVRRRKSRIYTTRSHHWLHKYPNLIRDIELTKPLQLWVSDITYVRISKGFLYLSLVTDAYSRKIVGYHIAKNLEAVNTVEALKFAIKNHQASLSGLIHHSDRGIQYCSYEYVKLLKDNEVAISMTQTGDPRENPIAERINGILKDEYLLNYKITDLAHATDILTKSVNLYNDERPHSSIDFLTPSTIHHQNGI